MNNSSLSVPNENDLLQLKEKIAAAQKELDIIEQKVRSFEVTLQSHISDQIIEEQELFLLYKSLKKEKKAKRLEQKKKGKNYKEPQGLVKVPTQKKTMVTDDENERKRLYREAMLCAHPDKFSTNEDKVELATEITAKLVQVYKTGSLDELKVLHGHIVKGSAIIDTEVTSLDAKLADKAFIENQLEQLIEKIEKIKSKYTYTVLTTYEDPMTFLKELKAYYEDRIAKLKKRTRKASV